MKILIADDHQIIRRGLKDILADEFDLLRVGEACDGPETLEAARKQAWDIVLLDIKMPGRSGLEVLEELKKLHPKMPVVMISRSIVEAHDGHLWAEANPDCGMSFRFTLPIYPGESEHGA